MSEDHQQDGQAKQPGKGHPIITSVISGLIVFFLGPALLGWWHKDGISALHSLISFLSGAFTFGVVLFLIWLIFSPSKKETAAEKEADAQQDSQASGPETLESRS